MSSQLNLANSITIARILLVPVFLVILLSGLPQPYGDLLAAAVFILAAATDKLDGYVARRSKQVTTLGQFLDPLADKLLIAAALIALVAQDRVAAWVAMVIIGREIAVSVLRIIGVSQGVSIPADKYGKLKTVLQIVYVVYVLFPTADIAELIHVSTDVADYIQWALAVVVVVVTLASGVRYFMNARGVIRMPGDQQLMPPGAPRAAVVLSGNELLDGRTRDTNGAFVCDDLSRRGVKVTELLTVADDRERLTRRPPARAGRRARPARDRRRARHHARRPHRRVPRGGPRRAARGGPGRARLRRGARPRRRRAPPPRLPGHLRAGAAPGEAPGRLHCRAAGRRRARHRGARRADAHLRVSRACPTNFNRCGSRRPRRSSATASSRTSPCAWSACSASASCRSGRSWTRCRTTSSSSASTSAGER